jgi:hypothetical protein
MPDLDPAVLVKVSDGITVEVNAALEAGIFTGLQFKAESSYADFQDDELDDLDCLKVDVVPVGYTRTELDDRSSVLYVTASDIAVRKKFSEAQLTQSRRIKKSEIDRLVLFVQELHEFFLRPDAEEGVPIGTRLTTFPEATWRETNIRTTFSRRHLRDLKMFLGVIRVSYEVSKPL